jgi:hypothetical protein
MTLLDKARRLESKIAGVLNRAAGEAVGSAALEPIEILHGIVDAVEREVQSGSRGASLFPFTHIVISVLAPGRDARARCAALFDASPSLRARILDRLRSRGCDAGSVHVAVNYAARPGRDWTHAQYHVSFDRVDDPAPAAAADARPARLEITVVHGAADRRTYAFSAPRIDLGRGAEVRDSRHRLLRTNQVAFVEGSDVNHTVSRRHAHIVVDAAGDHRLHDDRSEHGTCVVRDGRSIGVPAGSRGVRLLSGDEISLGEARVRIRILR